MTKWNCLWPISLTVFIVGSLVFGPAVPTLVAQTPGTSMPALVSSTGADATDDDLTAVYSLTGPATTAATAWYRNGRPIMSLYLPFEGGPTAALNNYAGPGGVVTAVGTPAWSATAGPDGSGAFVQSSSQYLDAGNTFPVNSSYSAMAWFNRATTSGTVYMLGSATSSHGLRATYDGLVGAGHNGNWRIVQSDIRYEITANTWFFVGVTFDAATGRMILYKDGLPIDSAIAAPSELDVTDPSVQIGAMEGTSSLIGSIDDVRIYNHVLSEEQMAALFATTGRNQIVAEETFEGDTWQAMVTAFSATAAGPTVGSNVLTLVPTPPSFTSVAKTSAIAGKNYTYQASATGGPVPVFTVDAGPTGLTIDPTTGIVTWLPLISGAFAVTLSATNSQGIDIQSFAIDVAEPSVGIGNAALTTLPNGNLQASNSLTLNATSAATAWYKDGAPLMELYMPFEGGEEYALEDYSGNGRVATPMTATPPVFLPAGGHDGNGAMEFNGTGFLNVGNYMPTQSSYTKTIWFYHTADREFVHLLSGWDHSTGTGGGHGLRVSVFNRLGAGQDGKWNMVESPSNSITLNEWHFGAVTFDYTTGRMILYLNGTAVDSTIVAPDDRDVTDPSVLVGSTRGDYVWNGRLDDARLFNFVASPEQIAAMFSGGGDKIMVARETQLGEVWETRVTGFSGTEASVPYASNTQTIGSTNEAPVLAAIGSQSVDENQLLQFVVSAADGDGTIPALSASPLPPNATFVDNSDGTGLFTFMPSFTQAGVINVMFEADDGEANDIEVVTITVNNVNRLPVLAAIGPQSGNEGELLSIAVSATDADATLLTLTADPLPTNAAFVDNGDGTGLFTFTPDFDQAGLVIVTFAADDGEAVASEEVAITNTNVNRPPSLAAIGPQLVDEGVELVISFSATDPDGATPMLSVDVLPDNAFLTDNGDGTGSVSFTPSFLQAGEFDIRFRAFDPELAGDSELVQITVIDVPQSGLWSATIHAQGTTVGTAVSSSQVQIGVQLLEQQTPASPPPPAYTTNLQLYGAGGEGPFSREIGLLGGACCYWTIALDPHGTANPPAGVACATLSWDPNEFNAENNYVLREGLDPAGPIVVADMRTTTAYEVCDLQTERFYTIHWEEPSCAAISYAALPLTAGWNLVSLPVIPESNALADLIPTAEVAYSFDGVYNEATTLEPCLGYWVKVPADVTIALAGPAVTDCSGSFTEGWRLVGGPNCTAIPATTPGGALQSLFGFDGAYQVVSQTGAGFGYWAEISPTAILSLTCSAPVAPSLASTGTRIGIRAERVTKSGTVGTAFVEIGTDDIEWTTSAPPAAPEYAVQLKLYRPDMAKAFYRDTQAGAEPASHWILAVNPHGNDISRGTTVAVVSWDAESLGRGTYELRAGIDGSSEQLIADMRETTGFEVSGENRDQYFSIIRTGGSESVLPGVFTLNQNYPNPFNPSTVISFSLPTSQDVRLEVFNVLGQRVATLHEGRLEVGEHTVEWEARTNTGQAVSSGVYFYRLETAGFSETRKMLLLR